MKLSASPYPATRRQQTESPSQSTNKSQGSTPKACLMLTIGATGLLPVAAVTAIMAKKINGMRDGGSDSTHNKSLEPLSANAQNAVENKINTKQS